MLRSVVISLLAAVVLVGVLGCQKGTSISKLEPNTGNVSGGDTITIYGNGLKPGVTVHFGKRECQVVVVDQSGKSMRVKTPSGAEGPVDVIITDDDGKTFMLKEGFRYHSQVGK